MDFVPAGARGEGIAGFALAVADLPGVLASARARGLPAQGDAVELFGTRIDLRVAE